MFAPIEQVEHDEDHDYSPWPEPYDPPAPPGFEGVSFDHYAEAELQRRHARTQVMIRKAREQLL